MMICDIGDLNLHYLEDGDPNGKPVVFANSLGTDFRLWDKIIPRLPRNLRLIRFDKRGHGLSQCPAGPYTMGALVRDTERLIEVLGAEGCVLVGLSIGGMIAQGLAVKRPDLLRAVVLSNTGVKIGTPEIWDERIATVRAKGIEALADGVMGRWFSKGFRETPELKAWRNMLVRTPAEGYAGCSAAISGTDFYATNPTIKMPALAIAGSEDGSTPPDLMRETIGMIEGGRYHLIRGAGHLPCVEKPEEYAEVLNGFLEEVGHV